MNVPKIASCGSATVVYLWTQVVIRIGLLQCLCISQYWTMKHSSYVKCSSEEFPLSEAILRVT